MAIRKVVYESQNRRETIMHTNTVIYSGDANEVTFTVPENSLVQYFNFSAAEDTLIESAYCGDTKIPLKYKLLPSFIANRLQGLFANQNAIVLSNHNCCSDWTVLCPRRRRPRAPPKRLHPPFRCSRSAPRSVSLLPFRR